MHTRKTCSRVLGSIILRPKTARALRSCADATLGCLNVVGHREAAKAIRTTFPGVRNHRNPWMVGKNRFAVKIKLIKPWSFSHRCRKHPELLVLISNMISLGGFAFGPKPDFGGEVVGRTTFQVTTFHVPSVPCMQQTRVPLLWCRLSIVDHVVPSASVARPVRCAGRPLLRT
jgi:hypothetical protein